MESKEGHRINESKCEATAWLTVVLGLANTVLFSGILFGWASLQSFLEDDGVYQELCDSADCEKRNDQLLYLYSNGQAFSIFAYAFLSLLMDRTGPVFLCIVGGLFETAGLLLIAYADMRDLQVMGELDILDFAVCLVGIGGSAIMVHALKLAFLVPAEKFAWIMTLTNCMVDASAATPAFLYALRRLGLSRQHIFTSYGVLCFLLNAILVVTWCPNLRKLRAKNAQESAAREANPGDSDGPNPRLHGLALHQQLMSFEFVYALVMYGAAGFAATSYMGFNKNLLSSLGDEDNIYAQIFTALIPVSILFSPLFGWSLAKKGFAFTFALVLLLGLIWSSLTLLPQLPAQPVTFFVFSNYRAMLYAAHFTFLAHTFGNRTFGSVNAILSVLAAVNACLIRPCAALSQEHFDSLVGMSYLMMALMLPPSLLTLKLARHLRIHPAGDVCSVRPDSESELEPSSESLEVSERNLWPVIA